MPYKAIILSNNSSENQFHTPVLCLAWAEFGNNRLKREVTLLTELTVYEETISKKFMEGVVFKITD